MAKHRKVNPKRYTGGCLCGAIRFEALGPVQNPHTCSCKMCQRHSGALTSVWVEFAKAAVTWMGPGSTTVRPALFRSSPGSSRAFCQTCGSTLGAIDDKPIVALLLGAFDAVNRKELMPTYHSFRSGRPSWWHVEASSR